MIARRGADSRTRVGDPAFEGAPPSDYYGAGYGGVVIAAVGLMMLPVHLAAYRERGILRRLEASHLPRRRRRI